MVGNNKKQTGLSFLEATIALPIFIVSVFFIIEICRYFFFSISTSYVAFDAVDYAVKQPLNQTYLEEAGSSSTGDAFTQGQNSSAQQCQYFAQIINNIKNRAEPLANSIVGNSNLINFELFDPQDYGPNEAKPCSGLNTIRSSVAIVPPFTRAYIDVPENADKRGRAEYFNDPEVYLFNPQAKPQPLCSGSTPCQSGYSFTQMMLDQPMMVALGASMRFNIPGINRRINLYSPQFARFKQTSNVGAVPTATATGISTPIPTVLSTSTATPVASITPTPVNTNEPTITPAIPTLTPITTVTATATATPVNNCPSWSSAMAFTNIQSNRFDLSITGTIEVNGNQVSGFIDGNSGPDGFTGYNFNVTGSSGVLVQGTITFASINTPLSVTCSTGACSASGTGIVWSATANEPQSNVVVIGNGEFSVPDPVVSVDDGEFTSLDSCGTPVPTTTPTIIASISTPTPTPTPTPIVTPTSCEYRTVSCFSPHVCAGQNENGSYRCNAVLAVYRCSGYNARCGGMDLPGEVCADGTQCSYGSSCITDNAFCSGTPTPTVTLSPTPLPTATPTPFSAATPISTIAPTSTPVAVATTIVCQVADNCVYEGYSYNCYQTSGENCEGPNPQCLTVEPSRFICGNISCESHTVCDNDGDGIPG